MVCVSIDFLSCKYGRHFLTTRRLTSRSRVRFETCSFLLLIQLLLQVKLQFNLQMLFIRLKTYKT